MKKNTVLGILAHVDAGKTTVSEQILYRQGVLRAPGRVDRKNTLLDSTEVERRRGITVFSGQAGFSLGDRRFFLLDTPGHVDFSGEMERCLQVLDCALLVVSAVEGVQSHTETLWRLLKEKNIPVFLFLNKMDRPGAETEKVMAQLEKLGGPHFFLFTGELSHEGEFSETASEFLAGLDDALLERYLDRGYERQAWLSAAKNLVEARGLFPVFCGAALLGEGISELLSGLRLLAPFTKGSGEAPFSGRVYQVRREKGSRVAWIKVETGFLRPKAQVLVPGEQWEKCNELRRYSGGKFELVEQVGPGELCAVTGLQAAKAGDKIGEGAKSAGGPALVPLLSAKVLFDSTVPAPKMLACFRELEEEEPLLSVFWQEESQEIEIRVMGQVQLEVLEELFLERFGEKISFGPCSVVYQETLQAPVVGCGHFEPLRHYAEVHLLLTPGPRGSGITFASRCPLDSLSSNWQNLVETHVMEKTHRGVLTGAALTDVEVTLLSGRAHLKHTEGGDFREAVYRAIRQGLMCGESLLLEPYYQFTAEVEPAQVGRVQADIARMEGECQAPVLEEDRVRLFGRAPIRTMMDYPKEFAVFTRGKGRLSLEFGGYEPCRAAPEVIQEKKYDPERDVANSPDSVFCSHGAGFLVKWNEACRYMHLPVERP